jgi:uncharacterized protein YjbI with pentapeptide repeats
MPHWYDNAMKTPFAAARAIRLVASLFLNGLVLFVLAGCTGGGTADPYSKRYSAADINANPAVLDGTRLRGCDVSGMLLENVTLSHTTFMNVTGKNVVMRNVVLNNCRFIDAVFEGALLENVTMKGGLITCEADPYNLEKQTRFSASRFTNVLLDDVSIENAVFEGDNSSITLKNSTNIIATHPIFLGANVQLVFDNCFFKHMTIAEVTGKSSLTATNCLFQFVFFGESTFSRTTFRDNVSLGGPHYGQPSGGKSAGTGSRVRSRRR